MTGPRWGFGAQRVELCLDPTMRRYAKRGEARRKGEQKDEVSAETDWADESARARNTGRDQVRPTLIKRQHSLPPSPHQFPPLPLVPLRPPYRLLPFHLPHLHFSSRALPSIHSFAPRLY